MDFDYQSLALTLTKLKMYPVFDVVHYISMCLLVREDIQKTVTFPFTRQHPLSSWVASMLLCFASSVWFCFLFSRPLAEVFMSPEKIAIASGIWYAVNYSPLDVVYVLLSITPSKCVLVAMKEVHRVYGIYYGVTSTAKDYPEQYLLWFMAGLIKGSASSGMKPVSRFIVGVWMPAYHELLHPTFVFKASCAISLVFCLEYLHLIQLEHSLLFVIVMVALVYLRLSEAVLGTRDPFMPFENLLCSLVFGGMWDALKRASKTQDASNGHGSANSPAGAVVDGKLKKS